jgi:hypothetical protein
MATEKRIAISKASEQLGVSETSIREAIRPLYPDNWQTIKTIKLSQFESLAQALADLAQQSAVVEEETGEITSTAIETLGEEPEPLETDLQELETELEPDAQESDTPIPTSIIQAESDDLATQEAEVLKVSVINAFADAAIDLNRVVSALAYSSALRNFESFKVIHEATLNHHIRGYIRDTEQKHREALNRIEGKTCPKEFLREQGIPIQ